MEGSGGHGDGHIPDEAVFGEHIFSNYGHPSIPSSGPAAPRVGLSRPPHGASPSALRGTPPSPAGFTATPAQGPYVLSPGGQGIGSHAAAVQGAGAQGSRGQDSVGRKRPPTAKKKDEDIPGSGKFKKKALQNEELLTDMFKDITNEDADHWNPMSDNPIIPDSQEQPIDVENETEGGGGGFLTDAVDAHNVGEEDDVREVGTPNASAAKRPRPVADLKKKAKSSTAIVIQDALTKMSENTTAFIAKKQEGVSVKEVMDLVIDCGADFGSNEHDIATQLFQKKDAREMFMTLPTREIRLNWLRKRYNDKYGN